MITRAKSDHEKKFDSVLEDLLKSGKAFAPAATLALAHVALLSYILPIVLEDNYLVVYTSARDTLVTTLSGENKLLEDYFENGERSLEDYERKVGLRAEVSVSAKVF